MSQPRPSPSPLPPLSGPLGISEACRATTGYGFGAATGGAQAGSMALPSAGRLSFGKHRNKAQV